MSATQGVKDEIIREDLKTQSANSQEVISATTPLLLLRQLSALQL